MKSLLTTFLFLLLLFSFLYAQKSRDYIEYHKTVLGIEELIIKEDFQDALYQIDEISNSYEFVFLKEYKIATQLAIYIKDFDSAFKYLKLGISEGWTLKEIKKNKFIKPLIAMKDMV